MSGFKTGFIVKKTNWLYSKWSFKKKRIHPLPLVFLLLLLRLIFKYRVKKMYCNPFLILKLFQMLILNFHESLLINLHYVLMIFMKFYLLLGRGKVVKYNFFNSHPYCAAHCFKALIKTKTVWRKRFYPNQKWRTINYAKLSDYYLLFVLFSYT